jgi:hypothetical protein
MLEWAQKKCGGAIGARRKQVCRRNCSLTHVHSRKLGYRWVIRGERAIIVLENIFPYLQEKQDIAIQVINHTRSRKRYSAGDGVRVKMSKLGWE